MGGLIIQLFLAVIMGIIACAIANAKGRNAIGWFFGGFFLGLIGVVIIACLPNLNEQKRKTQHADRERRLLREQLYQERLKLQAHQQYTNARLGVHDEKLGIDTANQASLPESTVASPQFAPPQPPMQAQQEVVESLTPPAADANNIYQAPPPADSQKWYIYIDEKKYVTDDRNQIISLIRKGTIKPETLIHSEGLDAPIAANQIGDFAPFFS